MTKQISLYRLFTSCFTLALFVILPMVFSLTFFKLNKVYAAGNVLVQSGCNQPTPYVFQGQDKHIYPNTTSTITLEGIGFIAGLKTVQIPNFDGTVDNVTVNTPYSMDVTLTAGSAETTYDIVLTNGCASNTVLSGNGENMLLVEGSHWLDLRSGGDNLTIGNGAANNIRHRSGMTAHRDANGMYFTGVSPWSSWVKVKLLSFTRGTSKNVEWIFKPTTYFMVGIGSDATNESNNSQWNQAEWQAYFNSGSNFWGFYGNDGTVGTYQNQSVGQSVISGDIYKIKFINDGSAGETIILYRLPSANPSDWNDESNVVRTVTSVNTADEVNLMPFIIPPNGGTTRFIAVRVE